MPALGIRSGARLRAVMTTVDALAASVSLPAALDARARFAPSYAWVRRVVGENLWIWYRFDDANFDALVIKDQPPVPEDEDPVA